MVRRIVTIEHLAGMVQRGFKDVAKQTDVDRQCVGVAKRFDVVEDHLDRIEKLILADHKRRIERLEEQMKDLRDLLAVK